MNAAGSATISGLAVLESPRCVDPQKGPRNVVFDANFSIVEGSETVTMGLLRYFASNEMANEIQTMADKPYQKAFIVANVCHSAIITTTVTYLTTFSFHWQITSLTTPNDINNLMSGFEPSDYAFVGDIYQVCHYFFIPSIRSRLIHFQADSS